MMSDDDDDDDNNDEDTFTLTDAHVPPPVLLEMPAWDQKLRSLDLFSGCGGWLRNLIRLN